METNQIIQELEDQLENIQLQLVQTEKDYDALYNEYKKLNEQLPYPKHHLTVSQLRDKLSILPGEGGVYIQRVEDVYFEQHGWKGKMMPQPEDNSNFDEYVPVWCTLNYDDKNLYLTPHY